MLVPPGKGFRFFLPRIYHKSLYALLLPWTRNLDLGTAFGKEGEV
jgi:hypothetical protein